MREKTNEKRENKQTFVFGPIPSSLTCRSYVLPTLPTYGATKKNKLELKTVGVGATAVSKDSIQQIFSCPLNSLSHPHTLNAKDSEWPIFKQNLFW